MNKIRRESLQKVIEILDEQRNEIDNIRDEECEAYENLPENLNNTERANNMYQNIDDLEQATLDLEDIINNLEEILER